MNHNRGWRLLDDLGCFAAVALLAGYLLATLAILGWFAWEQWRLTR